MAGIEKMYGTQEQRESLVSWCKENKPSLLQFVFEERVDSQGTDEINPIARFSENADAYLWDNCPLQFVQECLKEQYSTKPIANNYNVGEDYDSDFKKYNYSVLDNAGDCFTLCESKEAATSICHELNEETYIGRECLYLLEQYAQGMENCRILREDLQETVTELEAQDIQLAVAVKALDECAKLTIMNGAVTPQIAGQVFYKCRTALEEINKMRGE